MKGWCALFICLLQSESILGFNSKDSTFNTIRFLALQHDPTGGDSLWGSRDPDSIETARPPQRSLTPQTSPHIQRVRGPAAAGPYRNLGEPLGAFTLLLVDRDQT